MSISYEICRTRNSNATYGLVQKNGQEVVTKNITVTYRVHAKEGSNWPHARNINASDVDEEMVRNAPPPQVGSTFNNTLPVVGDTVFESPDGNFYPWWRCTAVTVNRNTSNGLEFSVSCTFVDSTGNPQGMTPPADVENVPPVINYEFDRFEVTAWTEDQTTTITGGTEPPGGWPDPEPCTLPTGTLYSNPPVKIIGQETITFSQYEGGRALPDFTLETVLGNGTDPPRLFSVNKTNWPVYTGQSPAQPNEIQARHAMISDIAYEETTLLLADGTKDPCQRVTYTIMVRRYELQSLKDNPSSGNLTETLLPGWDQPRVRADTRFLDSAGFLHPASMLESWGTQQAYLKSDGRAIEAQHQYGVPPYQVLKLQPEIDFTAFLR